MHPLEEAIGFQFKRPELLKSALTHRSHPHEDGGGCNERLEFLGDSVLSAVVAHALYERHPDHDEGTLSKRKAVLVSRATLARWAEAIELGKYLRLGAGEETTGGRMRPSLLANAYEALIGAVYVDSGFEAARRFVLQLLDSQQAVPSEEDFKSRLQEVLQKKHKSPPSYELVREAGPDHDKTFSVAVRMGKQKLGAGEGKTKKEAEQKAAQQALEVLTGKDRKV